MRERFTEGLASVHEAKRAENDDLLAEVVSEYERDFGGEAIAPEIVSLQEQKLFIMEELKAALREIDESGTVGLEGKMRSVSFDGETMFTFAKGGSPMAISEGQLLVAGMWDEEYFLDPAVSRSFKKQYVVTKAKQELADIYDHQIALAEAHQSYNKNTGLDDAYAAIAARYEEGAELENGVLAEKMVQSFLTKLTHDYDMPYRIKQVTVYEDVEYKIDFIIEPIETEKQYGVGVEEPHQRHDIAIQFTTARSQRTIEHKERQIDRAKGLIKRDDSLQVDDLVLVTLPIEQVRETYDTWQNTKAGKRVPGGPDELWSRDTQEEVFVKLLKQILPAGSAQEAWDKTGR